MISQDGVTCKEGDMVWVPAYEGKDTFLKPIPKKLLFTYRLFWVDFQSCVEYCKTKNKK